MPFHFRPPFKRTATEDAAVTSIELTTKDDKYTSPLEVPTTTMVPDSQQPFHVDNEQQAGVQDVELVTQTWSKASLIAVFIK